MAKEPVLMLFRAFSEHQEGEINQIQKISQNNYGAECYFAP